MKCCYFGLDHRKKMFTITVYIISLGPNVVFKHFIYTVSNPPVPASLGVEVVGSALLVTAIGQIQESALFHCPTNNI